MHKENTRKKERKEKNEREKKRGKFVRVYAGYWNIGGGRSPESSYEVHCAA